MKVTPLCRKAFFLARRLRLARSLRECSGCGHDESLTVLFGTVLPYWKTKCTDVSCRSVPIVQTFGTTSVPSIRISQRPSPEGIRTGQTMSTFGTTSFGPISDSPTTHATGLINTTASGETGLENSPISRLPSPNPLDCWSDLNFRAAYHTGVI